MVPVASMSPPVAAYQARPALPVNGRVPAGVGPRTTRSPRTVVGVPPGGRVCFSPSTSAQKPLSAVGRHSGCSGQPPAAADSSSTHVPGTQFVSEPGTVPPVHSVGGFVQSSVASSHGGGFEQSSVVSSHGGGFEQSSVVSSHGGGVEQASLASSHGGGFEQSSVVSSH